MLPDSHFLRTRLEALTCALDAETPAQLAGGVQQAYAAAFGLTAALGVLLGLLGLWLQPLALERPEIAWALLGTGSALATLMFLFSGWQLRRGLAQVAGGRQRRAQLLAAAFSLSAAPAVPWLLACAALPWPQLALGLAGLAALAYALGRWQLGQWAQQL